MASYYSKDAKCPFYQYDDPRSCNLVCESFAPGSTIKNHFTNKDTLKRYACKYCCDCFESCTWYRVVSMAYKE